MSVSLYKCPILTPGQGTGLFVNQNRAKIADIWQANIGDFDYSSALDVDATGIPTKNWTLVFVKGITTAIDADPTCVDLIAQVVGDTTKAGLYSKLKTTKLNTLTAQQLNKLQTAAQALGVDTTQFTGQSTLFDVLSAVASLQRSTLDALGA